MTFLDVIVGVYATVTFVFVVLFGLFFVQPVLKCVLMKAYIWKYRGDRRVFVRGLRQVNGEKPPVFSLTYPYPGIPRSPDRLIERVVSNKNLQEDEIERWIVRSIKDGIPSAVVMKRNDLLYVVETVRESDDIAIVQVRSVIKGRTLELWINSSSWPASCRKVIKRKSNCPIQFKGLKTMAFYRVFPPRAFSERPLGRMHTITENYGVDVATVTITMAKRLERDVEMALTGMIGETHTTR